MLAKHGLNVRVLASQSIEPTSLYDLIEIDEKMASSMVKEQLNHF